MTHLAEAVEFDRSGDHLTVYIGGELDGSSVERIEASIASHIHSTDDVIWLDLEAVTFCGSVGVTMLLRIRNHVDQLGAAAHALPAVTSRPPARSSSASSTSTSRSGGRSTRPASRIPVSASPAAPRRGRRSQCSPDASGTWWTGWSGAPGVTRASKAGVRSGWSASGGHASAMPTSVLTAAHPAFTAPGPCPRWGGSRSASARTGSRCPTGWTSSPAPHRTAPGWSSARPAPGPGRAAGTLRLSTERGRARRDEVEQLDRQGRGRVPVPHLAAVDAHREPRQPEVLGGQRRADRARVQHRTPGVEPCVDPGDDQVRAQARTHPAWTPPRTSPADRRAPRHRRPARRRAPPGGHRAARRAGGRRAPRRSRCSSGRAPP